MENNSVTPDNQIHLTINKEGKLRISYKKAVPLTEFIQILSTAILGAMQSVVQHTPPDQKQEVTEDIYDMYNAAASNTLHYFAPDIDMRPHLTSQAILEAEDKIINRMYKQKAGK